jgi:hypothetical protein
MVKKETLVVEKQLDDAIIYRSSDTVTLPKLTDSGIIYAIPDASEIVLSVTAV